MNMPPKHTIGLGGLGGDSHSVGLILLRWTLEKAGYRIIYLGTQNPIEAFFDVAPYCNIVMVSCMDGHARNYLRRFPEIRSERPCNTLWYVGGNPSVEKLIGGERTFVEMGFARVFLQFVDLDKVLDVIVADLENVTPLAPSSRVVAGLLNAKSLASPPPEDQLATLQGHDLERRDVLQQWRTGAGAKSLEENAGFLLSSLSLADAERRVDRGERSTLVQPRSGVALVDDQLKYFRALGTGGADVLSFQIDSYTRNNNYAEAQIAIRESSTAGFSTMNGFPAVNHGVEPLRRIVAETKKPMQFRHSTRDPRLLSEICFAGGVSAFEGGAICYNIPYYRDYPLERAIPAWQYVDRLAGRYHDDFGVVVHREFFGVLTGTLVPPAIAIATGVLESLLAARQGVKAVAIGFAETGCRFQDIAALRSIQPLARKYLDAYGYTKVAVGAIFNQYMAAFPLVQSKARDLITASAATAKLGRATRMLTKTAVEAIKIPSLADNLEGLALNHRGIEEGSNSIVDEAKVAGEVDLLQAEVAALVDNVIELGFGNIAEGIVKAFREGSLDVPFAPSIHNAGRVMAVRDLDGALRYLSHGTLPLSADVIAFHRERISERRRYEGGNEREDYRLVERDLLRVARGQFARWPLDLDAKGGVRLEISQSLKGHLRGAPNA